MRSLMAIFPGTLTLLQISRFDSQLTTYDLLCQIQEKGGHWMVGLAAKEDEPAEHAAHA